MVPTKPVTIVPFQPHYQNEARFLVLDGLAQRWGRLDESLNADLDDIAEAYREGHFLLAMQSGVVVGTGALQPEGPGVMRVTRMSTSAAMRNTGIGGRMLEELLDHAREDGCKSVVLETTATWKDAVRFYLNRGFRIVAERNGDIHLVLDLTY